MANMDYTPVKYIIQCMENFYPDCLAAIIIHKAPWFFSGLSLFVPFRAMRTDRKKEYGK